MRAAVIGATGYGGVELLRLLQQHPVVNVHSVHSSSNDGLPLGQMYGHLSGSLNFQLESIDIDKIGSEVDVVFMATPAGVSSELTPQLSEYDTHIIDLSGDLRLQDNKSYERWYNKTPAPSQIVEEAVYGLSEWNSNKISEAKIIANPGCYPTAVLLGLAPLVQLNLIKEESIIIDAKSGVSGAGRNLATSVHFAETNENLKIYKVNKHQHIPEIEQMLLNWNDNIQPITLSTHLVPMTRGIMATMYVEPKKQLKIEELYDIYRCAYDEHYFVRLKDTFPSTKEVYGSNYCDIALVNDERTGRITIVSVIDNLVKGAAGQAIQNLNIILGMDEHTGLNLLPVYP
ncbi:N-acetyl-gamma-glutamyl-phosphate reductase [Cytobacillus sp. IB215665]|uniref:N-acetyl-gamma-glutamyl-phosphate reductase n=1 Tax=Cytobacillus sp. IB215665 TaxID=3097357 RepID=UPI002A0C206E|nr:N-acetyl-gamma-glutamyl-phosphate reductase [Cytobacillus sp. IB215665]MDX8364469.1 N-acetyl-gamma-glutamyl-phosphate reductase [Cytobacillus sp. IB215665]